MNKNAVQKLETKMNSINNKVGIKKVNKELMSIESKGKECCKREGQAK